MFRRAGWDWRWLSWRRAAHRAAGWTSEIAEIAEVDLPASARIGFAGDLDPDAVILDLAIQAAGHVAVPLLGDVPPPVSRWCDAWAGRGGEAPPGDLPAGIPLLRLSSTADRKDFKDGKDLEDLDEAGGALVRGAEGAPLVLPAADLAAAAAAIADALPAPPGGAREIFVLAIPPAEPAGRALLAWAVAAGAALLLEPAPGSLAGTAVWARPTVFAGTAADLAGLRQAVARWDRGLLRGRRRARPPFGRLRAALIVGPPVAAADAAFWDARGVAVRFLPQCGIAGI